VFELRSGMICEANLPTSSRCVKRGTGPVHSSSHTGDATVENIYFC